MLTTQQFKKMQIEKFLINSGLIDNSAKSANIDDTDVINVILDSLGFSAKFSAYIFVKPIPSLYRVTRILTAALSILGFIFMFVDKLLDITNLSSVVYIIWILSCMSLYITNKVAIDEWKKKNGKK